MEKESIIKIGVVIQQKEIKICKHKVFSFACSMSVLYVIKGCGYMEAIPTLLIDFHSLLTVSTVDWLGHK